MKKILIALSCALFSFTSKACDEATITLISQTNNGNGTYTYSFNLCIEFLGLEGSPDWFALQFSGGTYTSISSFTPPTLTTTTNDDYNGAINGNSVRWTTPEIFPSNGSPNFCNVVTVTTNGQAGQVQVSYHDTYPSASCYETLIFPIPCSISAVSAGTQSACNPGTNTYTQGVTVTYTNAPASGTLNVNGQSFAITSSPQTVTLTNLTANGNSVNVTAQFSADPSCTLTSNGLFTAPPSCSTPPCTPDNGTWD